MNKKKSHYRFVRFLMLVRPYFFDGNRAVLRTKCSPTVVVRLDGRQTGNFRTKQTESINMAIGSQNGRGRDREKLKGENIYVFSTLYVNLRWLKIVCKSLQHIFTLQTEIMPRGKYAKTTHFLLTKFDCQFQTIQVHAFTMLEYWTGWIMV